MEHTFGRPPLGDIYFPTRQVLTEDNAYLSNVGLIVLIRGSMPPNLPRLIADKLTEIHGGHPNDFIVTQASISPYLVTCRNTHLRDTIVRRGMYTVPQARVQFTILEWRPRFGMGYDPPTHQAWVKIVGLPLQAWTMPQITAILRNFGHPMQVLPFGQEAGHFRDVTALVATKNLNRIPLAYTYWEGDYTTKIDILILSSRIWEESYFPPPGDDSAPFFSQPPLQDQAGPSNPEPRSPSSSDSSGMPSEPTIDLSAWSPRSYNITFPTSQTQVYHPIQTYYSLLGNEQVAKSINPIGKPPSLSPDSRRQRGTHTHDSRHASVTKNPNLPNIPRQLSSILYTYLTAVPNPIAINPLRSLRTVNSIFLSLGEAQKSLNIDLYYAISLTRSPDKASEDAGILWEESNLDFILSFENATVAKNMLNRISAQPDPHAIKGTLSLVPLLGHKHTCNTAQTILPSFSGLAQNQDTSNPNQTEAHSEVLPAPLHIQQHKPPYCNSSNFLMDSQDPNSIPEPHSETVSAPPKLQQNKQGAVPTRRSQRILEKRTTFNFEQKAKKRTKTQITAISFDKDSHQSPLDASRTLQILQATGLTIDKQIEDLIDEAVKQDQAMENADQPTPTTPVHDPIPPLAIPGTDLLL